jgi:hypothetical protein
MYLALCLWLYSTLDLGSFFSFLILDAVDMTPWKGDEPVTYTQNNTNTE